MTRHPDTEHPLIGVLRKAPGGLKDQLIAPLAAGSVPMAHRKASDDGYTVTEQVTGRRLLLVDDTLTTGARMQSAASALTLAGGIVVGALVVGRVINPAFSPESQALWTQAIAHRFDFAHWCVHVP